MEVKLEYSPVQLEAAVKFISENNPVWHGEIASIRDSIEDGMREIVEEFPHLLSLSTMGYMLIAHIIEEDLDEDENSVHIEILVDPAVGIEDMEDVEEVYQINKGL